MEGGRESGREGGEREGGGEIKFQKIRIESERLRVKVKERDCETVISQRDRVKSERERE